MHGCKKLYLFGKTHSKIFLLNVLVCACVFNQSSEVDNWHRRCPCLCACVSADARLTVLTVIVSVFSLRVLWWAIIAVISDSITFKAYGWLPRMNLYLQLYAADANKYTHNTSQVELPPHTLYGFVLWCNPCWFDPTDMNCFSHTI